jgi:hypothetical protein
MVTHIDIIFVYLQESYLMTLIDTYMKPQRSSIGKVILALFMLPVFLILCWQDQLS